MSRRSWLWVSSLILTTLLVAAGAIGTGILGTSEGPGAITGGGVAEPVIEARTNSQRQARAAHGTPGDKDILFGDFHTHTTLSMDAFLTSLDMAIGEGSHPQADACDFARYCSALDFWSINDHAEYLTPRRWRETVESIRDCNARAPDPQNPDTVAFLGWEWTHIGDSRTTHWGHKNVIIKELTDDRIPSRAIQAHPTRVSDLLDTLSFTARTAMALAFIGNQRIQDFARYVYQGSRIKACPDDVHVKDLPHDCMERASDPEVLHRKLNEWDLEMLVIPHGNSWGVYTPPGSSWDKHLNHRQHDVQLQTLIEVYSGHGNIEEYRNWRAMRFDQQGNPACPAPNDEYTPMCWRAGDIIQTRCLNEGEDPQECAGRALEARNNYLAAPTLQGEATVPFARDQDWLDAGQCRDCFLPPWYHRPANSAQYALALTNFEDPNEPLRFRFGFIGSSDVHTARPGTGYKEYDRFYMADFQLPQGSMPVEPNTPMPSRSLPWEQVPQPSMFSNDGLVDDRQSNFFFTGGLIAAHTEGRNRYAIWDALERREVYATSGPRILLWFDLLNAPEGRALPMGAEVSMRSSPTFRVAAVGSFEQLPGCPTFAVGGLTSERLQRLCRGECYHPSDQRRTISRIEVIRIRPQAYPGEPIEALIEDPWRVLPCEPDPTGCQVAFSDGDFDGDMRDTVYYVRAIEEPGLAVNGAQLECEYNDVGTCIRINPSAAKEDDRLAAVEERAWSSPIFVNYDQTPPP
ncbi:MAG: DUF3604 domain-containing protein [Pseudomonadota bacterium]